MEAVLFSYWPSDDLISPRVRVDILSAVSDDTTLGTWRNIVVSYVSDIYSNEIYSENVVLFAVV